MDDVAIVSGGLGDIGRAIARELAGRGAAVALGDVQPVARAKSFLRELGPRARYDRVDVSDARAVRQWLSAVERACGTPNWIIPNAAIVTVKSIRQLTPAAWQRELAINLTGAYHLATTAAARLAARKRPGRIVFVGSWAGHRPHPHIPAYCVAKAGLRMLMRVLALEYAADDILVNEVAPGYVDAGLSGRIFAKNPALKRRATAQVPVRRLIAAADVAREVAHLCDSQNRHMTGNVVVLDGGLSLR